MNNLPVPFNQLPPHALSKLTLKKQETLFNQGDSVSGLFYLESGEVTLSRYGLAGEEIIIHLARSQETFAEAAIFSEAYHCNAVATENTLITKISTRTVLEYAENHPDFSVKLMARFASQIQTLRSQKELIAIRSAHERVYIAISQGLLKDSIKQFSATIALSHEATYRALAKLVSDKRLIKVGRGNYSLPLKNPAHLIK